MVHSKSKQKRSVLEQRPAMIGKDGGAWIRAMVMEMEIGCSWLWGASHWEPQTPAGRTGGQRFGGSVSDHHACSACIQSQCALVPPPGCAWMCLESLRCAWVLPRRPIGLLFPSASNACSSSSRCNHVSAVRVSTICTDSFCENGHFFDSSPSSRAMIPPSRRLCVSPEVASQPRTRD